MQYEIKGTVMQSLCIQLEQGEKIYSEAGSLLSIASSMN